MKDKYKFKLNKKEFNYLWKRTRWEVGRQLALFRLRRNLLLDEISPSVHIPAFRIESMELGRGDLSLNKLLQMARFYGQRISIIFSDPLPEDYEPMPLTPEYLKYMKLEKVMFEKDYYPDNVKEEEKEEDENEDKDNIEIEEEI